MKAQYHERSMRSLAFAACALSCNSEWLASNKRITRNKRKAMAIKVINRICARYLLSAWSCFLILRSTSFREIWFPNRNRWTTKPFKVAAMAWHPWSYSTETNTPCDCTYNVGSKRFPVNKWKFTSWRKPWCSVDGALALEFTWNRRIVDYTIFECRGF